jgi:hypothetical protein
MFTIQFSIPFGVLLLLGALANGIVFSMVGDINERLPNHERRSLLGWYPSKFRWLWNNHQQMYPDSKKRVALIATGIALLVVFFGFLQFPK